MRASLTGRNLSFFAGLTVCAIFIPGVYSIEQTGGVILSLGLFVMAVSFLSSDSDSEEAEEEKPIVDPGDDDDQYR